MTKSLVETVLLSAKLIACMVSTHPMRREWRRDVVGEK